MKSSRECRKGQSRGMIALEKLAFIRECYEHVDEYKPWNKTAF